MGPVYKYPWNQGSGNWFYSEGRCEISEQGAIWLKGTFQDDGFFRSMGDGW